MAEMAVEGITNIYASIISKMVPNKVAALKCRGNVLRIILLNPFPGILLRNLNNTKGWF